MAAPQKVCTRDTACQPGEVNLALAVTTESRTPVVPAWPDPPPPVQTVRPGPGSAPGPVRLYEAGSLLCPAEPRPLHESPGCRLPRPRHLLVPQPGHPAPPVLGLQHRQLGVLQGQLPAVRVRAGTTLTNCAAVPAIVGKSRGSAVRVLCAWRSPRPGTSAAAPCWPWWPGGLAPAPTPAHHSLPSSGSQVPHHLVHRVVLQELRGAPHGEPHHLHHHSREYL